MIELYSGPKGVMHHNRMRILSANEIMKIANNSADHVRRVDWDQKSRVGFVIAARKKNIASSIK